MPGKPSKNILRKSGKVGWRTLEEYQTKRQRAQRKYLIND